MSEPAASPPDDSRAYRHALGAFVTGVCVVTADTAAGPVGITVNSFTSVSLDPRLVLWCLDKGSERASLFGDADRFAIQVLAADQRDVAARFAKGPWTLQEAELRRVGATPCLPSSLAWFACETDRKVDAGDHLIIIGRVLDYGAGPGDALTFHRGHFSATRSQA